MSLLIHSMVSPTFAEASAGATTKFSIVIWMVAGCAETDIASVSAATLGRIHLGIIRNSLLQRRGDVFGMLLMALENLEAGLQPALQLRVVGVGNKRCLHRAFHRLVLAAFVPALALPQ